MDRFIERWNLQNSWYTSFLYNFNITFFFLFFFNRVSMILRVVILRNKTVSSRYCVCMSVKYLVYIYIYIFIVYRIFIYHLFDFYKKIYVHAWDLIRRVCTIYLLSCSRDFEAKAIEGKACNVALDGKYNPWKRRTVSRFAIESMRRDQICPISKFPLLVFQGLLRGYRQRNLEVSLRACKW